MVAHILSHGGWCNCRKKVWAKSEIRESGGKGFGLYLLQDIKVGTEKSLERIVRSRVF
jgi:hypothetical protein